MSLLLNLRIRRVRDLLLELNIWEHAQVQPEQTDAELSQLESTLVSVEALQAKTWDSVSCKLKTQSYCREEEFWADCSPYLQAVSEVPQLKRLHYECMVLSKQIMVERLASTHGVENKVAQAHAQLQRDAQSKATVSEASDVNLSRLFSVAAQALIANKEADALLETCQLECGTHTDLDIDVRRVLLLLQKSGGKGNSNSSASSTKRGDGRRSRDAKFEHASHAPVSTVGLLSLARGEGGVGAELWESAGNERGHVSPGEKRGADGAGASDTLVGVTLDGKEVARGEKQEGVYLASVAVGGKLVALGEFSTALKAAQAHDRAYMRALGPQRCAAEELNFPVESYSRDSMTLLTAHDDALRRALQWGVQWRGLQDCDFAFLISQQGKRGARLTGAGHSPSPSKTRTASHTRESANGVGSREASPSKRRREDADAISCAELVGYALPDLSAWLPASAPQDGGDRRRNIPRNQRYWQFDGTSPAESARCGDVPPLHCYILAQELITSRAAMAISTSFPAPEPEDVVWESYERPYAPREQESLVSSRSSSGHSHVLPAWERCLSRSAAAQRDLAAFRTDMLNSLSILEERQARLLVKRGLTAKRCALTGVRQLSSKHPVFLCTLPENVMDPLSRHSTNQDVEFGCFGYALEAAMVREQISNHVSHTKRTCSNFSGDEWELLRGMSAQLVVLLKAHKAK